MVNSGAGLERDGRNCAPPAGCVYQMVSHKLDPWTSMLCFTTGREYAPHEELWLTHLQKKSGSIRSLVYVIQDPNASRPLRQVHNKLVAAN